MSDALSKEESNLKNWIQQVVESRKENKKPNAVVSKSLYNGFLALLYMTYYACVTISVMEGIPSTEIVLHLQLLMGLKHYHSMQFIKPYGNKPE